MERHVPLPRLELSGRDWQLRNLVQEFVAWPARTAPPVLILLGPPGSGKTTFLGLLRSRLADVPHAHADLGTAEGAADFPLLSQLGGLAFQLRAHFGTQPTLDLSAFRTALLVATAQADGFDSTRAYRDIRAAVRGPGREPGAADAAIQQLLEQAASIANAQLGQLAGISLEEAEKELIRNTLKMVSGNREQAAKILGIGERTLYRKIKEYEL
jgi:DNA-binding protein Fis